MNESPQELFIIFSDHRQIFLVIHPRSCDDALPEMRACTIDGDDQTLVLHSTTDDEWMPSGEARITRPSSWMQDHVTISLHSQDSEQFWESDVITDRNPNTKTIDLDDGCKLILKRGVAKPCGFRTFSIIT